LQQSKQSLARFYNALRFLDVADRAERTVYEKKFREAMDDDFNTPVALSVLFDLAHEIQRCRNADIEYAAKLGALLRELGGVLGILQSDPESFFQSGQRVSVAEIELLIAARQKARSEKNWEEADRIRKELTALSIEIEDSVNGTTWKSVK